ncbi:class I SAM-dependent methyltransferase [Acinetobacter sp. YH12023]|uniref:class I SAM-dependent methyltransferase n=1 Tax=Acinetobacter sp. YH12023 TaxID=2601041 RepID=UPI0015D248D1|nr:class I SAM-dependent methyltransferase [Acinetobacter sp. YH12023]
MNDLVINAIQNKTLTTSSLDFNSLRSFAGIDTNNQPELNRGRAIIPSPNLLNQYLYSYGPMVQRQWDVVVSKTLDMLNDNNDEIVHIFDYGCGQGLATLLLLEKAIGLQEEVKHITLVEPSEVAIKRAESIIGCKAPEAELTLINKELDDVEENDLSIDNERMNVHLFSNILDVEGFDQFELFNKILKNGGTHYFIVVSNDRNYYGGSPRLEALYNALLDSEPDNGEQLSITHAELARFVDDRNMKHIYFCVKVEIK